MVARIAPSKPIKHFLKEWRLERRLTQQQLADLLPVGPDGKPTGKDQVSRWERNERGMTMGVQAALAEALGITPVDLFRSPNASPPTSLDRLVAEFQQAYDDEEADDLREHLKREIVERKKLIERNRPH